VIDLIAKTGFWCCSHLRSPERLEGRGASRFLYFVREEGRGIQEPVETTGGVLHRGVN
jgi:hypothetical protein